MKIQICRMSHNTIKLFWSSICNEALLFRHWNCLSAASGSVDYRVLNCLHYDSPYSGNLPLNIGANLMSQLDLLVVSPNTEEIALKSECLFWNCWNQVNKCKCSSFRHSLKVEAKWIWISYFNIYVTRHEYWLIVPSSNNDFPK